MSASDRANTMRELQLRKDVRSSLEAGHPWIYGDALHRAGERPGELVRVVDRDARTLAIGFVDEGSIGVRVLGRKKSDVAGDLVRARLAQALAARAPFLDEATTAFRWVHGEADRLPGLVVDLYGAYAVARADSLGAERFYFGADDAAFTAALTAVRPGLRGVLVRKGRQESKSARLAFGEVPAAPIPILEHGMTLLVDLHHGQKTGLFLDHRASRRRVRELSRGREVLNLYGYTGGFSIAAGLGGATRVETVDVAVPALELARASWAANGLPEGAHETHAEDVPTFLGAAREAGRSWDLIVADPPSFAPNEASVPNAMRSYRALHRACLRLLRPGGLYLAASCSSHVGPERFDRTLREATPKVPRHVRVLERWGGGADHPRLTAFPEGDYLKCVLLSVDGELSGEMGE